MIKVVIKAVQETWVGLAYDNEAIVACAIGADIDQTRKDLTQCLPANVPFTVIDAGPQFTEELIPILYKLHKGLTDSVTFPLAIQHYSVAKATILLTAAKIPLGYVTSYGSIAEIAEEDARTVGQVMANNPLYPLVPCHRVVGSDFSLVGYGGKKSRSALKAKLKRLQMECRNQEQNTISINGKQCPIFPTENVIAKAKRQGIFLPDPHQQTLTEY